MSMTETTEDDDLIPYDLEEVQGYDYEAHKQRMEQHESERRAKLWPFQDFKYNPDVGSGRPISISWLDILEVIEIGVTDLTENLEARWVTIQTYKTRTGAAKMKSRMVNEHIAKLPSGRWEFGVDEDPFDQGVFYLKARYLPKKFSDIKNIQKIPEEKREKLLEMLHEYAQKKKEATQDGS